MAKEDAARSGRWQQRVKTVLDIDETLIELNETVARMNRTLDDFDVALSSFTDALGSFGHAVEGFNGVVDAMDSNLVPRLDALVSKAEGILGRIDPAALVPAVGAVSGAVTGGVGRAVRTVTNVGRRSPAIPQADAEPGAAE